MKTNLYPAAIVLSVAWVAAALSGCCSSNHDPCAACYPTGFGCFGYHSTSWRPWPEECPTCPSFAIMPPPAETILKDVPMGQESLPVPEATPMTEPEQPAPIVEPEEGRLQHPHVRKVSRKRIRPAPTDNR